MSYNDPQWTAIVGGGHGHYGLCVGGSEPACQAGSATYAGKPSWWWEIYLNVSQLQVEAQLLILGHNQDDTRSMLPIV